MNDFSRTYSGTGSLDMSADAGLRKFMLGVYNKLGLGLLVTAVVAYSVGTFEPLTQLVFNSPLRLVVQWGPLALLFGSNFLMRNPSPMASGLLYWAIVALLGAQVSFWVVVAESNLSGVAPTYAAAAATYGTIAKAAVITGAAFFGLSLYGYTTKRNLTGLHSAIVLMSWGALPIIFLATFMGSSLLMTGIMFGMLAIYGILIVTQTQQLKVMYAYADGDERSLAAMTNHGALNFYIAVISIFQILMSLFSGRE